VVVTPARVKELFFARAFSFTQQLKLFLLR
jgi:hypothetical protein